MAHHAKTKALVAQLHGVAELSAKEMTKLLAKLESGDLKVGFAKGEFHPMVLNAIMGTSVDKIAKYENWEKKGSGEAGEWTAKLVAGLKALGDAKVTLEIEQTPRRVQVQAVDVPYIAGHLEGTASAQQWRDGESEQDKEKRRARQRAYVDRKRHPEKYAPLTDSTEPQ